MPPADASEPPLRSSAEGSQPRWRAVWERERPRGTERWRFDLHPREPVGAPATDGATVFLTAARPDGATLADGELWAFDLLDGSVRWRVPLQGVSGAPVEFAEGRVWVRTRAHCADAADAGAPARARCGDSRRAAVVAFDPTNGHELRRWDLSTDEPSPLWTAAFDRGVWVADRPGALRDALGTSPARSLGRGAVLSMTDSGGALFALLDTRPIPTLVKASDRVDWSVPALYRGSCPPVVRGPLVVVPSFATERLQGPMRCQLEREDRWLATEAPTTVYGCAAADARTVWQAEDLHLVGRDLFTGRVRARFALPSQPTGPLTALADGVFYVSIRTRLYGVDLIDGHASVELPTGAEVVEGLVLRGTRGVLTTRRPGQVLGFE